MKKLILKETLYITKFVCPFKTTFTVKKLILNHSFYITNFPNFFYKFHIFDPWLNYLYHLKCPFRNMLLCNGHPRTISHRLTDCGSTHWFFTVILKNVCSILLAFFTLSCWKFKYHVNGDLSVFEQHYYLVVICRP